MNKIYDNLEKIACFTMVSILIISSYFFITSNAEYKIFVEQKKSELADMDRQFVAKSAEPGTLLSRIDEKTKIDLLKVKRNIFAPFKDDDEKRQYSNNSVLEVLDIAYKPLAFQYQGRIIYPNGQIVAQINADNKSYLVKTGSNLGKYKVGQLDKDSINLKTKQGENVTIKYLQTAFSDELMAKIKESISGEIETVYKNSDIYGYKVLDIEEDCVILSKSGQHLRLQKGMVQAK
ncbi:MAG: hypothetical protein V1747_04230 [Candidatus Omnitrophota bacterium]